MPQTSFQNNSSVLVMSRTIYLAPLAWFIWLPFLQFVVLACSLVWSLIWQILLDTIQYQI